jgi:hypothetical protein
MSREFPKNNSPENIAPKIALPTVGRIVHVFGVTKDGGSPDAPRVAMVCGTEPGQLTINAAIWTRTGDAFLGGVQNLPHVSLPRHDGQPYWDWMDYQKGQAAKTEQLEQLVNLRNSEKWADTPGGNELAKTQAGTPSPVDGKR